MKLVLALWDTDQQALLGEDLRSDLRSSGCTRLQVNLDADLPENLLRLQHFDERVGSASPSQSVVTGEARRISN